MQSIDEFIKDTKLLDILKNDLKISELPLTFYSLTRVVNSDKEKQKPNFKFLKSTTYNTHNFLVLRPYKNISKIIPYE